MPFFVLHAFFLHAFFRASCLFSCFMPFFVLHAFFRASCLFSCFILWSETDREKKVVPIFFLDLSEYAHPCERSGSTCNCGCRFCCVERTPPMVAKCKMIGEEDFKMFRRMCKGKDHIQPRRQRKPAHDGRFLPGRLAPMCTENNQARGRLSLQPGRIDVRLSLK